jgi:hypothetical protein
VVVVLEGRNLFICYIPLVVAIFILTYIFWVLPSRTI